MSPSRPAEPGDLTAIRQARIRQSQATSRHARELAEQVAEFTRTRLNAFGPMVSGPSGPGPWARSMLASVAPRRDERPGKARRLVCEHLGATGPAPGQSCAVVVVSVLCCSACVFKFVESKFHRPPQCCDVCSRQSGLTAVVAVAGTVVAVGVVCSTCLHVEQTFTGSGAPKPSP